MTKIVNFLSPKYKTRIDSAASQNLLHQQMTFSRRQHRSSPGLVQNQVDFALNQASSGIDSLANNVVSRPTDTYYSGSTSAPDITKQPWPNDNSVPEARRQPSPFPILRVLAKREIQYGFKVTVLHAQRRSKRRRRDRRLAHGNAVGKRINIPERRRRDTAQP